MAQEVLPSLSQKSWLSQKLKGCFRKGKMNWTRPLKVVQTIHNAQKLTAAHL